MAALILRLAVPSLQDNPLLNNLTTLLLGISCGALYFIRKDYPAPKASKLDGVVNAVRSFSPCFTVLWACGA